MESNTHTNTMFHVEQDSKMADYIVRLYKSIGASKEEAINMVDWYGMTDRQIKSVKQLVNDLW